MSGIFTTKSLAAGYLSGNANTSNAQTILYQAPASNTGYVKAFSITSENATIQQISLYKTINGNTYHWYTMALNLGETVDILDNETIALTAGDAIRANTNSASVNAASFSIHGVEEH